MMMFRSNKSTDADALFDAIRADVFVAMESVGQQEAAEWRERVSVSVQYAQGPRGGQIPIRSQPGEPPRRERGDLYDSIDTATESDADVVTTTVDSDVDHALYTDQGTERMAARPHAPDLDAFAERLLDAVVTAIAGG